MAAGEASVDICSLLGLSWWVEDDGRTVQLPGSGWMVLITM